MFKPSVSLTVDNASAVLEAGLQAIAAGQAAIDLSEVATVDSSAVATLLAWQRAAKAAGRTLEFGTLPANLQSLAELYGVTPLLNAQILASGRHH